MEIASNRSDTSVLSLERRRLVLSLAALAITCGCASEARLRVAQPATAPVSAGQSLVVLPVEGGDKLAGVVHEDLVSELQRSRHYRLLPPQHLVRAARGRQLYYPDQVDRHAAVDAARRGRVDLLLASRFRTGRPNVMNLGNQAVELGDTHLTTQLEFELIDVRSGKILLRDTRESDYRGDLFGKNNELHQVLTRLASRDVEQTVHALVPHYTTQEVALKRAWWGRSGANVRKGVAAARAGNWQLARKTWQKAVDLEPDHAPALYNLGVAHEALGHYAEADHCYRQAIRYAGSMDVSEIEASRQRLALQQQNAHRLAQQLRPTRSPVRPASHLAR